MAIADHTDPPMPWTHIHRLAAVWYAELGRDLPWRKTHDPYLILVSEIMLQQTQVARVIPIYKQFTAAFPSFQALSVAPTGMVVRAWAGLGYNVRAVRLQRLAQKVVSDFGGDLPSEPSELVKLPGIGVYTASAISCFAFGSYTAVADTNIYRVLSRMVYGAIAADRKTVDHIVSSALPTQNSPLNASSWHQALMDIGSTVCTARKAFCSDCPFESNCAASETLREELDAGVIFRSVPNVPKQSPFQGSIRAIRGRVLTALRATGEEGLAIHELERAVQLAPGQPKEHITEAISGLIRDGLAVACRETLYLP